MRLFRVFLRLFGTLLFIMIAITSAKRDSSDSTEIILLNYYDMPRNAWDYGLGFVGGNRLLPISDTLLSRRIQQTILSSDAGQAFLNRQSGEDPTFSYWTPDRQWQITFLMNNQNQYDVIATSSNGSVSRNLTQSQVPNIDPNLLNAVIFSPDSQWVYFHARRGQTTMHYWRARLDGTVVEDLTPNVTTCAMLLNYAEPEYDLLVTHCTDYNMANPVPLFVMDLEGHNQHVIGTTQEVGSAVIDYLAQHDLLLIRVVDPPMLNGVRASDGTLMWSLEGSTEVDVTADDSTLVFFYPDGATRRCNWDGTGCMVLLESNPTLGRLTNLLPDDSVWFLTNPDKQGTVDLLRLTLDSNMQQLGTFQYLSMDQRILKEGWIHFVAGKDAMNDARPYRMRYGNTNLQPVFSLPNRRVDLVAYGPKLDSRLDSLPLIGVGGLVWATTLLRWPKKRRGGG